MQLIQCYSLSACLFFSWGLILPILSWLCLFSSSMCRIPFRIFCSGGLVVIYCFSFCLSWKTFIPPSILNDSFAGQSILGLKLFSFSAQNTSLHALLAFKVSIEKSVLFWWVYLYILFVFSLLQPSIFFLWSLC
jgi:hypothetical protein